MTGPHVEIYRSDGSVTAPILHYPVTQNLQMSSQVHGGFMQCSFDIAMPFDVDYPELPFGGIVKVISRAGSVCWQGRIEDRSAVYSEGAEYVRVQAVGDYDRMNDQVYHRIWADRRLERWWHPDTTISGAAWNGKHRSDLYKFYESEAGIAAGAEPLDVLGIAAVDGTDYSVDWYGLWKYEMPAGETVKRVTFDYETFFPRGNWRFGVFGETGGAVEGTAITATGSGSVDLTMGTASQRVWMFLQAGPNTPWANLSGGMSYKWNEMTESGANWSEIGGYGAKNANGSNGYAKNTGANSTDYIELAFTGTGVTLFGAYGHPMGQAEITIRRASDSVVVHGPVTVDLWEDTAHRPSAKIPEAVKHGLALDSYVLKVRPLGTHYVGSDGYEVWIDYALVDQGVWAQVSNVVVYGATGTITADVIIKSMLTASCPDISSDQSHIDSPGVSLSHAVYEAPNLRPTQVAEDLAAMGNTSNALMDLAVWTDAKLYFNARPTAYTHWVQKEDCEIELGESTKGLWNRLAGVYGDDHGGIVRMSASNDTDSQTNYGIREFELDIGREGTAIASQRQATALAAWKEPGSNSRITIRRNLRNANNAMIPLEELRAGSVLMISGLIPYQGVAGVVDERTVFYCKQVSYDGNDDTVTISPGEPNDSIEAELARMGGA